jgi:uncharacterized membrane protein
MTAGQLAGVVTVVFVAATLCLTPVMTRPTVPFGVRVPGERTSSPVIRRERRAYFWRTAAVGACCTVAALLLHGHRASLLSRIILLLEIAADLGCYWLARQQITAVKAAEDWYAGHRQIVATDTSWRTDPPHFPVRWLIPALAVIAVTVVVGAVRYPDLPARLAVGGWGGRRVPRSVVSAFAVVVGQLYVTALWTGMMLLVYRARPDIEATDPAASTRRYRRFLTTFTGAMLTLVTLVDLSLLLVALRNWQVYRLSGPATALPVLPFAVGLLVLAVVSLRTGQGGSRLPGVGVGARRPATETDRDDDRFWKAGLIYVNRDDPAILVGARFGVGWTFNLANPVAWLVIAAVVAMAAGLAAIVAAAGR